MIAVHNKDSVVFSQLQKMDEIHKLFKIGNTTAFQIMDDYNKLMPNYFSLALNDSNKNQVYIYSYFKVSNTLVKEYVKSAKCVFDYNILELACKVLIIYKYRIV